MFPGCSLASFLNRSETLLSAFCTVLAVLQPARKSQEGQEKGKKKNNLLNFRLPHLKENSSCRFLIDGSFFQCQHSCQRARQAGNRRDLDSVREIVGKDKRTDEVSRSDRRRDSQIGAGDIMRWRKREIEMELGWQ